MPRLQILSDNARRNFRRDKRDVVVRSQEHTELVFSSEDLTHALSDRYDVAVSQVGEFPREFLALCPPLTIRKQQQVKLRLLQFLENALPVDHKIRETIAGFDVI